MEKTIRIALMFGLIYTVGCRPTSKELSVPETLNDKDIPVKVVDSELMDQKTSTDKEEISAVLTLKTEAEALLEEARLSQEAYWSQVDLIDKTRISLESAATPEDQESLQKTLKEKEAVLIKLEEEKEALLDQAEEARIAYNDALEKCEACTRVEMDEAQSNDSLTLDALKLVESVNRETVESLTELVENLKQSIAVKERDLEVLRKSNPGKSVITVLEEELAMEQSRLSATEVSLKRAEKALEASVLALESVEK